MATELPYDQLPELAPLNWLIGSWEGQGRLGEGEESDEIFYQRVDFTTVGLPFVEYRAESWICEPDGTLIRPLTVENGFWSIDRQRHAHDVGPGMVPADIIPAYPSAEDVEKLRISESEFPITATISHPGSMTELYFGRIRGPQLELRTDAILHGGTPAEYAKATRIFGLVNGQMFWRWDVAGSETETPVAHASAILDRLPDAQHGRLKPGEEHKPGKHDLN